MAPHWRILCNAEPKLIRRSDMRLPSLVLCGLLFSRSLTGQQPAAPDSATHDTTHVANEEGSLLLVVAAAAVVTAAAPAALLVMGPKPDTSLSLPSRSFGAYVAVGGTGTSSPNSFTLAERADLVARHVYGSLASEDFDKEHLHFYSASAGYLLRPRGPLAGGLTLGYRHATGIGAEDAALIGIPFIFGTQRAELWLEPTYAVSRYGISWEYRFQVEAYLLPHPFFLGLLGEARPLRHGADYVGTVALLVGVHQ